MSFELLPTLITAFASALFGGLLAHVLARRRDFRNKRRELRLEYLIDAYRRIERASEQKAENSGAELFERALADIQLFGTAEQVKLAQQVISVFVSERSVKVVSLLELLRQDLRTELGLGPVPKGILTLRISHSERLSTNAD